ncbi:hypothetical protein Sdia_56360 [Streptomyces diastaticus subsp. diastaticus]|uniref:Uncharacterized protein n=2 Tax=Streptomyces TaxID=1883 RepID=A0ABQ1CXA0_STRDI|nr:hypothetical protein Sdia_56360 [Streptomyces diastaticus subsp. diastaticus]GGU05897.1 hypothetical protein GCM10015534_05050 [Streptomyces diastaticus subsp. diastaticus]
MPHPRGRPHQSIPPARFPSDREARHPRDAEDGPAMARPTPAQYATGAATVVLATVALLLLTGTTGTGGIVLVAAAALALGLLAAATVAVRHAPGQHPAAVRSVGPASLRESTGTRR